MPPAEAPVQATGTPATVHRYRTYLIGSLVFIAVIVVPLAGYLLYHRSAPAPTAQQGVYVGPAPVTYRSTPPPAVPLSFKGTLFLSLHGTTSAYGLGIYAFDMEAATGTKWTTLYAEKNTSGQPFAIYISPAVSPDGKTLAFARGTVGADGVQQGFQIVTSDIHDGTTTPVTHTPDKYKRQPVWSPSGEQIAYISQNDPRGDLNLPESWSTFVTDLSGKAVKISAGVNPLFSPDGTQLLILKNDGLHLFDIRALAAPKDKGLVSATTGGRASQQMKLSLSPDGSMLAWASAPTNELAIYHLAWAPFSLKRLYTVHTKAYWSVFSPDGKYLAVDEWRTDTTDGNEYPIIMGYDVLTGRSERIVTLTNDDKSSLWLGGWIW